MQVSCCERCISQCGFVLIEVSANIAGEPFAGFFGRSTQSQAVFKKLGQFRGVYENAALFALQSQGFVAGLLSCG